MAEPRVRQVRRRIHGVFLLNKPLGISSNAALQKVRWLFRAEKAGHTGALDPLATGLLPVCLGEATKFSHFLLDADKRYTARIQLGRTTTTADREGETLAEFAIPVLDRALLEAVLAQFLGTIQQVPPKQSSMLLEVLVSSLPFLIFIAVFVYRDMGLRDVPKVLLNSANMSAMLLYIITNAVLFSFLMTSEGVPQAMADWMIAQGFGPVAFQLVVNLLLLLAGNVMEPSSIILIMAPILFPVAMKLGVDPVHFGILITVNMEIGMCHPPVGLNLYVASGITKMGITELTVAVWPWLLSMLVFLGLVTYWPGLSLWFPRMLGMI
mgnify:CR=1 FL=1